MKEDILQRFNELNPKIVSLNPKIDVIEIEEYYSSETGESIVYDPPKLRITVSHPFVFDNRLVPEEFEGLEVHNIMTGEYPEEFLFQASLPYWEFFTIENYQRFVDNNFEYIKQELKSPNMTKDEMIDALTGGTEKLIKRNIETKLKYIRENEAEIIFFNELMEKTRKAYHQSDVYKKYGKNDWGYSVISTMIRKNKPLIVGFNWTVDKELVKAGNVYGAQKDYPFRFFDSNYYEMGSLNKVIPFLHEYIPQATQGMQTNFCFFRSEKEEQISKKDLELSAPLFDEFLAFSEPSIIISFSSSLLAYLKESKRLKEIETKKIKSGKETIEVIKAKLIYGNKQIPFAYLPHPELPMTEEARKEVWKFHFL